jgi:ferredoxin-NADP reductase
MSSNAQNPTVGEATVEALPLVLTAIRLAARDTNLYSFARTDGGILPGAEPGAHIGLFLPNGLERQYSLVSTGGALTEYVVGIKRDPGSRGGSRYIHDELRVGTEIRVAPPRNNFPLVEDAAHVVLVAGGIGITPIYAMARRLQHLRRSWTLHYCCRSRADAAFLKELAGLTEVSLYFDDEMPGQLPPIARMVQEAHADAHLYCCGPTPMLGAFEAACTGRPADRIHVEYFTQKYALALDGGYIVELKKSGREFAVPAGKSILHVLQESGINVPSSCEEGVCGACETRVISGIPDHRDAILSAAERQDNATMMICCSGCKSGRLVLDL